MERLVEEERIKVENENVSDGPVKDCDYISIKEELNYNEVKEENENMEDVLVNDCDHISIKNEVYYNEIENEINNIKEPVGKDEKFFLHTKENHQLEENYNPLNRENLKPVEKEIESINHINLNILKKDLSLGNENEENSNSSSVIDILRGLLTESSEHETLCPDSKTVEESASFDVVGSSSEVGEENNTLPQRFKVNLAAIDSISKENQASELQSLDGLSVYDQATLEAGILQQVDEALDQELETPARSQTAVLLEPGEEETEMERLIRLGEMTPFGTTLNMSTTPDLKPIDGLAEIEKYFQTQQELHGKRNRKPAKRKQITTLNEKGKAHLKAKENARDLLKEKILNQNKKKKKKKKETLGTETEDFVPWTEKPDSVAGETADMNPDDASGSEYVPSELDSYPSSGDEREIKHKEEVQKPALGRKRKIKTQKPYKIPEDWASDDTDWEYSDEEGNVKKNKRSKKELDDGDVDAFNRRIRMWQREKRNVDEEIQEYHEFDEGYKLPLDIWNKLYIYQRVGVKWLWELDKQGCGGVLGDEMGLGKTIQVIAFLAGLHVSQLTDKDTRHRGLGPSLIICPTTLMHQWVKEFHTWYPPLRVAILHESGTFCGKQRSRLIGNMVQAGGVLIVSYTGALQYKDDFLTRRWHYVILDEGHKIRNPDTKITLVVKQLKTAHRIILSGSPMQNNLKELWSLFDFVFPGKLGTLPVFLEQFAVPITQGGYTNASQVQVMTAFKCATVLKDTIAPYLLRRMKTDVKSHVNLPEKSEQVLFCRLTDEQRHFYKDYVESGEVSRIMEGHMKIFVGLINLRKICNHPDLYSGGTKLFGGDTEDILPPEERYGYWGKAGKMIVVETLLKLWKKQGHRVLVFTQSRQMLSIMETFVKQAGYSYLKLDGGTSIAARQPLINKFNQDTSYFVLLLTTRVGGLGVNLTGANRVLIYDPDWNPATDTQARERAWRIGQKQNVTVYRLITAGTIEEKMYHRQIFKQFLCNKVLKDPRQRRFFKSNDLFELFTLKETDVNGSTETGAIFAGTNSEVKLDPTKTYKHRKITPRLSAEPPAVTFSRKKAEKKKNLEEKQKENSKQNGSGNDSGICFSNEKIERMKKLAQMLSQKCVKNVSPEKSDAAPKALEENKPKSEVKIEDVVMISDEDSSNTRLPELSTAGTSSAKESPGLSPDLKRHKHKKRRKDKKKSRHRDAKFEGETIPHLVKTGVTNSSAAEVNADDSQNYATQDEYVLQKLFAKSGLQTALKHDTIMEGGPADYALVEGEADRVAKQAVEKLQESRRECWRATTGVPTFTGINGARNFQFKPKFGSAKTSFGGQSSSEILERIRKRNCIAEAKDPEMDLVQDIRQFVSSFGGTVTTSKVISRFEGRLAEGSSPLFKSLLSKICTFYRGPDKLGYWTLKEDFNW